jgi:mono/diheme cytochrome c family protein
MRLWKNLIIFIVLSITFFLGSLGMAEEAQNTPPPKPLIIKELPEFKISKGEILYGRYCSFCHGESGRGDGLNAYSMPVKPRNFNNQDMVAQKSDLELEKVILFGGNSQGLSKYMPAFDKTFSNLEAKHLIKYIHKDLPGNQN